MCRITGVGYFSETFRDFAFRPHPIFCCANPPPPPLPTGGRNFVLFNKMLQMASESFMHACCCLFLSLKECRMSKALIESTGLFMINSYN